MPVIILLAVTACSAFAADSQKDNLTAEEFVKAAQNYEAAAKARFNTAEALLAIAREQRSLDHADEAERISHVRKAGHLERQAGELFFAASQGYDRASAVWAKAAAEYKSAGKPEKSSEMMKISSSISDVATLACKRAAEAYEYSAEAFSGIDAGQMAESSDSAANMREALARRLK